MILNFESVDNVTRIYYGTDTRLSSFLVGSILANLNLRALQAFYDNHSKYFLNTLTVLLTGGIVFFIATITELDKALYFGGLFFTAILMGCVIVLSINNKSLLSVLSNNKLIYWIASRSYSLYLWHYALLILFAPFIHSTISKITTAIIVYVLSEITYKTIEKPCLRDNGRFQRFTILTISMTSIIVPLTFFSKKELNKVSLIQNHDTYALSYFNFSDNINLHYNKFQNSKKTFENINVLVFGDSVFLRLKDEFDSYFPNLTFYAKLGIPFEKILSIVKDYAHFNTPGNVLIINGGSNNLVRYSKLQELHQIFDKITIIFANSTADRRWAPKSNRTVEKFANEHLNFHLFDWKSACKKYFLLKNDEIHLNLIGQKFYVNKIVEKLINIHF